MPRRRSPVVALLADFGLACDELGVGWYLFGAQAALLYGSPRLTADADVTVQLGLVSLDQFSGGLQRHGFELREGNAATVVATRVLPVVHLPSQLPADVVLGGPGLEERFLERANRLKIRGVSVPVARAEDLIVMKVLAGRRKDEEDVLAILAAQRGKLQLGDVRQALQDLGEALADDGLLRLFERLLAESE